MHIYISTYIHLLIYIYYLQIYIYIYEPLLVIIVVYCKAEYVRTLVTKNNGLHNTVIYTQMHDNDKKSAI